MVDTLRQKVQILERDEIRHALEECNWVMAKAARLLGITERMIGYKVRKYGIIRKREVETAEEGDSGDGTGF